MTEKKAECVDTMQKISEALLACKRLSGGRKKAKDFEEEFKLLYSRNEGDITVDQNLKEKIVEVKKECHAREAMKSCFFSCT